MKYLIIILLFSLLPLKTTDSRFNHLPYNDEKPFKLINATIYAYNATTNQCDNIPNITASGYNISSRKFNVVANNCLLFGSVVSINNIIYTVLDKMHSRYGCNDFDILMDNYKDAINFGKQNLTIKIYDNLQKVNGL